MRILTFLILFLSSCSSYQKIEVNFSRQPASDVDCTKAIRAILQSPLEDYKVKKTNIVSLTEEEANTIKSYIFQGPIINYYLRNRENSNQEIILQSMLLANDLDEQKVKILIQNLDDLLKRHSSNQTNKIYFRGESRPNDGTIKVGAHLKYKNYISTTRNKELAIGYARGKADKNDLTVFYEIEIQPGQLGLQINEHAPKGIRNQDEFLLPRDGSLIINDISVRDGITYVKASFLENSTD